MNSDQAWSIAPASEALAAIGATAAPSPEFLGLACPLEPAPQSTRSSSLSFMYYPNGALASQSELAGPKIFFVIGTIGNSKT